MSKKNNNLDNEIIELLEFGKATKQEKLIYNNQEYIIKDFKFNKYYTIYNKKDEYVTEFDKLEELQNYLKVSSKNYLKVAINKMYLIKDFYKIHQTYELVEA